MNRDSDLDAALERMRSSLSPAEEDAAAMLRRRRVVSRLRDVQTQSFVRRDLTARWRRRTAIVLAALLLPSVSFAAWTAWTRATARAEDPAEAARPRAPDARHSSPARAEMAADVETDVAPAPAVEPSAPALDVPAPPQGRAARRMAPEAPRASTLSAENALVERALVASRRGDDARAVALLDQLLARYPRSPLVQNAQVERFRALSRLGDESRAARQARRYLSEHPDGMAAEEARRVAIEQGKTRPSER